MINVIVREKQDKNNAQLNENNIYLYSNTIKMAKSIKRTQYREMEKKFTPAIKNLSDHMHNTGSVPDDFLGYKIPAGEYTDSNGIKWQIQAWAVCSKKHQIRKNEIIPMIRKWALFLKFRLFLLGIVKSMNKK